ncbi:inositol monophosphatase [Candidatus Woesearchaeota archaeon]|jgi:myo-inositol-1(or 4)-monophosphatase|nr:inositol monophosphatase [Candidatus Woesearchaeota archaeon]MBT4387950.1 inositol monophosphatase [Candidatus Woesearchaeota archaeon]MBT4595768.1 inositol monophosphatase [Candidatus Woesearchaeota archaeon]MBT5741383.1 inositol monophosphatase [Candidatus Woesearchaeota archaeon]MBT6505205.1 inositol monophosphatase [Candidatus Woesearchaeota archaeon]
MLDITIEAAKEAGKILMKHYGKIQIEFKGEYFDAASILTQADIDSEKKIVEILRKNFPSHNIFSEEEIQENKGSEYTWYIDPLDGTSNFSRNIPLFGISIGLVKGNQSILGVLYFPALNLLVKAEKGKGAFANGEKISVSNRQLKESLYYSGGYHKGKFQLEKSIGDKVGIVKIIDASSYEFAQIAMGDAELYILDNVLHDVAAGVIIVKEAGGRVTDSDGSEWTVESKDIVASNKVIHDDIIKLL